MKRSHSLAVALAISLAGGAAVAEDWTPRAGGLPDLLRALRARARPAPAARAAPGSFDGACRTLVRTSQIRVMADSSGAIVRVDEPRAGFVESLRLRAAAAGEKTPILFTDRHGGLWAESAWTAEIVRRGGSRPPGPVSLEARHAGYLLAWPHETAEGCGGAAPEVTVLRAPHEVEAARKLIETGEFARRNKGTKPTAKPKGGTEQG